jgi:hypothetical protein
LAWALGSSRDVVEAGDLSGCTCRIKAAASGDCSLASLCRANGTKGLFGKFLTKTSKSPALSLLAMAVQTLMSTGADGDCAVGTVSRSSDFGRRK